MFKINEAINPRAAYVSCDPRYKYSPSFAYCDIEEMIGIMTSYIFRNSTFLFHLHFWNNKYIII